MANKLVTTVTTKIEGTEYTFKGSLTKDGKVLKCKKGMVLTIREGDIVLTEEVEIKKRPVAAYCPFDMHQFFAKTGQI